MGFPQKPLDPTRDLAGHEWAHMEWWYYTGHLKSPDGKKYGFELCFFKRRIDKDKVYGVPLTLFDDTAFMGHFAVVDISNKKYLKWGILGSSYDNCSVSMDEFNINIFSWKAWGDEHTHNIRAKKKDTYLDLKLELQKPITMHGTDGIVKKSADVGSYYMASSRMKAAGKLCFEGVEMEVSGQGWFDREFGNLGRTTVNGWDWFSIQLDNNNEYVIYILHDENRETDPFSFAAKVDEDGVSHPLPIDEVEITELEKWQSGHSGASYPVSWQVKIPKWDLDVKITACVDEQEFAFWDLTYWEGACEVEGKPANGLAYVELAGYTKSVIYNLSKY
jgi:predicted secreted hydrolase